MWCSVVNFGVWCSVVQCGAVWCSVVQCGAVWCKRAAMWCSVLYYVAVCCSVLQLCTASSLLISTIGECEESLKEKSREKLRFVTVNRFFEKNREKISDPHEL